MCTQIESNLDDIQGNVVVIRFVELNLCEVQLWCQTKSYVALQILSEVDLWQDRKHFSGVEFQNCHCNIVSVGFLQVKLLKM